MSKGDKLSESADLRKEIRRYIKEDRDTVLKKWMALEEAVNSEDCYREQFMIKQIQKEARKIPIAVTKLIGNFKKAVHKIMRDKGGTPTSILRKMILSWDSTKSGYLTESDFQAFVRSLGIEVAHQDLSSIYNYYSSMNKQGGLNYADIVADIDIDEPSIVDFVENTIEEKHDDEGLRFKEIDDSFKEMPIKVRYFVDALREFCIQKMRAVGGTPHSHIRKIFLGYDFDYSSRLSATELYHATKRLLKLEMTLIDCETVVTYYDRENTGEMTYQRLLHDVSEGMRSFLSFTEYSPRTIEETKKRLAKNPYYPVPFRPKPNKVLENIKLRVHDALAIKMRDVGGSYKSWITEALQFWDPRCSGYLHHINDIIGVFKRLNVQISLDEASSIMNSYDTKKEGKLEHKYLARDLCEQDNDSGHFLRSHPTTTPTNSNVDNKKSSMNSNSSGSNSVTISTSPCRVPPVVNTYIKNIQKSLRLTMKKSKGISLRPSDILHGIYLQYDTSKSGKINSTQLIQASQALNVTLSPIDASIIVTWYDSNGSNLLDYHKLVSQLYHINDDVHDPTYLDIQIHDTQLLPFLEKTKMGKSVTSKLMMNEKLLPGIESGGNTTKIKNLSYILQLDNSTNLINSTNNSSMNNNNNNNTNINSLSKSMSTLPEFKTSMSPTNTNSSSSNSYNNNSNNDMMMKSLETKALKEIKRQMLRNNILEKKKTIQSRLDEVEKQRTQILIKYNTKIKGNSSNSNSSSSSSSNNGSNSGSGENELVGINNGINKNITTMMKPLVLTKSDQPTQKLFSKTI